LLRDSTVSGRLQKIRSARKQLQLLVCFSQIMQTHTDPQQTDWLAAPGKGLSEQMLEAVQIPTYS
jgi:hypothetical protein